MFSHKTETSTDIYNLSFLGAGLPSAAGMVARAGALAGAGVAGLVPHSLAGGGSVSPAAANTVVSSTAGMGVGEANDCRPTDLYLREDITLKNCINTHRHGTKELKLSELPSPMGCSNFYHHIKLEMLSNYYTFYYYDSTLLHLIIWTQVGLKSVKYNP